MQPKKTKGHHSKRKPQLDKIIGENLRYLRTIRGFSQENLGEKLGMSFQQVQKYERGLNRISSSVLYELTKIMDVPLKAFFENLDIPKSLEYEKFNTPENMELIALFRSLPHELQKNLWQFMRNSANQKE